MNISPELIVPYPPSLGGMNFNLEFKSTVKSINDNLMDMTSSGKSLISAIALFEFSRAQNSRQEIFFDWQFLAARDGAMSIRNYGIALRKVRQLIGQIPIWLPLVDTESLKEAEKDFKNFFPFADKMRHSVAHPEFYSNPTKEMGVSGNFTEFGISNEGIGTIVVQGSLHNQTFNATFEGAFVHYNLDHQTAKKIVSITIQCFEAFSQINPHHR